MGPQWAPPPSVNQNCARGHCILCVFALQTLNNALCHVCTILYLSIFSVYGKYILCGSVFCILKLNETAVFPSVAVVWSAGQGVRTSCSKKESSIHIKTGGGADVGVQGTNDKDEEDEDTEVEEVEYKEGEDEEDEEILLLRRIS